MCNCCNTHPAGNAAISSATFSILSLLFAIIAVSTPFYSLESLIYRTTRLYSITVDFGLTFLLLRDPTAASSFTGTYASFVSSYCEGWCKDTPNVAGSVSAAQLRTALTNAGSAGGAAAAFFSFAIIFWFIHTVSTICHACNLRSKATTPICNPVFSGTLVGLIFCVAGFVCFIIAASISWAVFSNLAILSSKFLAPYSLSSYTPITVYPSAGAILSGLCLVFAVVAISCEFSARFCCKSWKPSTASLSSAAPTTVIMVQPPTLMQPPMAQYVSTVSPVFQPQYAAPPKSPPPGIMTSHWRTVSNGTETCESVTSPTILHAIPTISLSTHNTPFTTLYDICLPNKGIKT